MEITGRLTANAVVKTVKSGRQVVGFDVAVNDSYRTGDELKKVVTYFQCSYWINPAIAEYLTKGTVVELYGRIGMNVYKDMKGEPKGSLTFHVNSIKLHGGGNKAAAVKNETNIAAQVEAGSITEPVDDLPF